MGSDGTGIQTLCRFGLAILLDLFRPQCLQDDMP
jgi:hypothetical protein